MFFLPLLNGVDVLCRVDRALEPGGPDFEVGLFFEAVEENSQLLGELLAARGQVGITTESTLDVVIRFT